MTGDDTFEGFLRRIREGDEGAAVELVRRYESAIRIEVRARLTDPSLYRLFDSMDICQSVLASFFVRAAAGEYELESPRQLLKLLVAMTRNKVAFHARKQRSQRRDHRRARGLPIEDLDCLAQVPGPLRVLTGQDLLRALRERLPEEERRIADLRAEGSNWPEIAARLGGTPEARRKQFSRALDRAAAELGLEDGLGLE